MHVFDCEVQVNFPGESNRYPGTIDLAPYIGQVVNDNECPQCEILMPVCTLTRQKWMQPQRVTYAFLSDFIGFISTPLRGTTVYDFQPRIIAWGKHQFGEDYYGVLVREQNRKQQMFALTYVRYCYTWHHDVNCTKKHDERITDEVRKHFSPFERKFVVNWATLWDCERDEND